MIFNSSSFYSNTGYTWPITKIDEIEPKSGYFTAKHSVSEKLQVLYIGNFDKNSVIFPYYIWLTANPIIALEECY